MGCYVISAYYNLKSLQFFLKAFFLQLNEFFSGRSFTVNQRNNINSAVQG